ncbi:MAG TPA: hypothetical protein VHW90_01260 [Stellaceae bacterium]|jgi:hypothetical protein|nr:hypothetical protein [Stellaceae bacterium]
MTDPLLRALCVICQGARGLRYWSSAGKSYIDACWRCRGSGGYAAPLAPAANDHAADPPSTPWPGDKTAELDE